MKTASLRAAGLFLVLALSFFCCSSLYADGDEADSAAETGRQPAVTEFDEIVVTATRTEEAVFDVPNTVEIIDLREIMNRAMFRTVTEAIEDIPGVLAVKTSHGRGSQFIRGFTGQHTLRLIDGVRVNNSCYRGGNIDPFGVARLELVKGPTSVLYGSDAIGGTINFLTKSPAEYGEGTLWGGREYVRYSSAEDSQIARSELWATFNNRFGVIAGVSLKDFGDVDGGKHLGLMRDTAYKDSDGDLKMEYFLNENNKLVFYHQFVDQKDVDSYGKTYLAKSWRGTIVDDDLENDRDMKRRLTYLQYHGKDLAPWLSSMQANLSLHRQEEVRYKVDLSNGLPRTQEQGFECDTRGVWFQMESPSSFGNWVYGAEYYHDSVDTFKRRKDHTGTITQTYIQGPYGDDAYYDLWAAYVQNEYSFWNDRFDVLTGVRYCKAKAHADKVEDPLTGLPIEVSDSWNAFVGSVRFLWHIDEDDRWNGFLGVSQGFRAPTLNDITKFDAAKSANEREAPAIDLDPEKFLTYEIGIKARLPKWRGHMSIFYTDIDNMAIDAPTGRTFPIPGAGGGGGGGGGGGKSYIAIDPTLQYEVTMKNSGDGFVSGLELGAECDFYENFTAFGTFEVMDGEVAAYTVDYEKIDDSISRLTPPKGKLGVRWQRPEKKYWVEGYAVMARHQDTLSWSDKLETDRYPPDGTPGYTVYNLRSAWEVRDGVTLSVAIENITNKDYRIHGSTMNEPGTNAIFAVDWEF